MCAFIWLCAYLYAYNYCVYYTHTYLHIAHIYIYGVYTCMCMYIFTCACMPMCLCVCMYACMHVFVYVCNHVLYVCVHACIYAWIYVCMHVCVYVCVYVCTVVWEKFNGGNFHAKNFRVKIFSSFLSSRRNFFNSEKLFSRIILHARVIICARTI